MKAIATFETGYGDLEFTFNDEGLVEDDDRNFVEIQHAFKYCDFIEFQGQDTAYSHLRENINSIEEFQEDFKCYLECLENLRTQIEEFDWEQEKREYQEILSEL